MSEIQFTKMHGVGNDYIYVDTTQYPIDNPAELSRDWSRRHFGIGADGLVLIGRPDNGKADFSMRIFNADGSEGLMCGNASRCIGKYVYERGMTHLTRLRLLTASGVKRLELHVDDNDRVTSVTVDMLEPVTADSRLFVPSAVPFDGVFVSMGNPHFVVFVDDIDAVDVAREGARLECAPCFPERCNIEFVQVTDEGLRLRVWERGSGITLACGTGACASTVAAAITGRAGRSSRIVMDGGVLNVDWRCDNHVYLSGPATFVFDGKIKI